MIATFEGHIVAAKQRNILALSFHPELTKDRRIHHYYPRLIIACSIKRGVKNLSLVKLSF